MRTFLSSVRAGVDTLRANPLRTALSTLGVVIGVASLVAMGRSSEWRWASQPRTITAAIRRVSEAQVYAGFSWGTIVVAALMAPLVGMVFGTYPARRAANLSPVDAIRYEWRGSARAATETGSPAYGEASDSPERGMLRGPRVLAAPGGRQ